MSEPGSNSGFAFIAGLVVGAAAGAIAGLLFAPESGAETRKKLADKGKALSEDLHEKFDDLKESVSEVLEGMKKEKTEEA